MKFTERALVTGFLLLVVGIALASASMLRPVARTAPLLIGVPTMVLLAMEFARDRRRLAPGPERDRRAERELLAWLIASLALIALCGVILGTSVWLALFLRCRSRETWQTAVLFGVGLATVLAGILVLLLRLSPAAGAMLDWSL